MKNFLVLLTVLSIASFASAQSDTLQQASWSVPKMAAIKQQLATWLTERAVAEETREAFEKIWTDADENVPGDELLHRFAMSAALVDEQAKEIVALCEQPPTAATPRTFKLFSDANAPVWLRTNLRLLFGAWLARHEWYDEAAEQLSGVKPEEVVDPASLLFYQAVANHRLLRKKECLPQLQRLLENEKQLPQRYVTVAKLMQHDLEPLEADSLDEISRMMDDVRRRLDLGRAGKVVRDEEQSIIDKLNKKIDEMEKQRKKQQQQAANQNKQPTPSSPAEQSQVPRDIHATDATDPKKYTKTNNWGNLPPKQRQQALQQIGRDLPSHFRDTIEEYFKRLAQDGNE